MIHELHIKTARDDATQTWTIRARCPCGWTGQPRTVPQGSDPAVNEAALVALRDEHTAYVEAQEP